jgi:uncharacterized membrane protein
VGRLASAPQDLTRGRDTLGDAVRDLHKRRRLAVLASLALLSGFTVAGVAARFAYTGRVEGFNLVWNLVLAWIPLAVALVVYDRYRRGRGSGIVLAGGALWLLFFPNAPYLVTGYKHVAEWSGAPVWFDVVVISASAWTGLLLGFVSLYLIQSVVRAALGATAAWTVALGSIAIGSFGIYLGRFERWNSWDVVAHPKLLVTDIAGRLSDPGAHPRTVAVTLLFTAFLTLAYFTFYSALHLARHEQQEAGGPGA